MQRWWQDSRTRAALQLLVLLTVAVLLVVWAVWLGSRSRQQARSAPLASGKRKPPGDGDSIFVALAFADMGLVDALFQSAERPDRVFIGALRSEAAPWSHSRAAQLQVQRLPASASSTVSEASCYAHLMQQMYQGEDYILLLSGRGHVVCQPGMHWDTHLLRALKAQTQAGSSAVLSCSLDVWGSAEGNRGSLGRNTWRCLPWLQPREEPPTTDSWYLDMSFGHALAYSMLRFYYPLFDLQQQEHHELVMHAFLYTHGIDVRQLPGEPPFKRLEVMHVGEQSGDGNAEAQAWLRMLLQGGRAPGQQWGKQRHLQDFIPAVSSTRTVIDLEDDAEDDLVQEEDTSLPEDFLQQLLQQPNSTDTALTQFLDELDSGE